MNKLLRSAKDTRYNKVIAPPLPALSLIKHSDDFYSWFTPGENYIGGDIIRCEDGFWDAGVNGMDIVGSAKTPRGAAKAALKAAQKRNTIG